MSIVVSLVIFSAFGWLVVRVTRPKTVATTFGFAAAVAAVASFSSSMFTAPLMTEQARDDLVVGDNCACILSTMRTRIAAGLLTESRRPGTRRIRRG